MTVMHREACSPSFHWSVSWGCTELCQPQIPLTGSSDTGMLSGTSAPWLLPKAEAAELTGAMFCPCRLVRSTSRSFSKSSSPSLEETQTRLQWIFLPKGKGKGALRTSRARRHVLGGREGVTMLHCPISWVTWVHPSRGTGRK